MATQEQLQSLVAQMPDPDERGMYTENVDKAAIDRAVAKLAAGGAPSVRGLIAMLDTPGSPQDVKPHYALHCLVNYALVKKDPELRQQMGQALAAALAEDHSDYIKGYLCQELQWAGGPEATAALGKLLLDPELVEPATMALVAIRSGAGPQFRQALPQAEGTCRLNIVQGLGAVEDRESIEALREALTDTDVEVQLAAGWGLAQMGDPGCVDLLIKAAEVPKGHQRTVATKHCLVLAEKLQASGHQDLARKVYSHLRQTRTDPDETYIRLAATRAMAAL